MECDLPGCFLFPFLRFQPGRHAVMLPDTVLFGRSPRFPFRGRPSPSHFDAVCLPRCPGYQHVPGGALCDIFFAGPFTTRFQFPNFLRAAVIVPSRIPPFFLFGEGLRVRRFSSGFWPQCWVFTSDEGPLYPFDVRPGFELLSNTPETKFTASLCRE